LSIPLPENWAEVTAKQFRSIFALLYCRFPAPAIAKIRTDLVARLLGNRKIFRQLDSVHIYDISNAVRFLWETSCPIAYLPSFRLNFSRYYLPESHLYNASFIEFIYADAFLAGLGVQEGEEINQDLLDQLVATLCRPQKFAWWFRKRLPSNDGDNRQKFNPALMKARAKKFRRLPLRWKLYVLAFFIACKHEIINNPDYNRIFPREKKKDFEEQQGGGWVQLLKDVASTRLYGNYDETAYYNLHTILTNLQDELVRQEKLNTKK
ncbi:MAG: hypothetical protein HC831_18715, partial [Chloroflexia bacterium]|nr:hypothetical protein [Chloroflexia bacterium]